MRTRTFVAVGQETATGGGHTNDRANLLLNMELGGMSTWHRSDQVAPPSLPYIDDLHEFHIDRVFLQRYTPSLLLNMQLGGVSTGHRSDQVG